ncbi:hypothetical protein ABH972_003690 [Bradyrhizobium ottawaense]
MDVFRETCDRVDDVLTAVENEKQPPPAQEIDDAATRIVVMHDEAKRGGNRARYQRGILERTEFKEMDVALEPVVQVMRERDRNGGLADAAWPAQRDETIAEQARRQFGHDFVPPDHPVQAMRQRRRRRHPFGRPRRERRRLSAWATLHRRDEAITPARDVGDVADTVLAVAEHLAQLRDMNPQGDLLDGESGPRVAENLVLWHHLAGSADEQAQNIHRPTAELDRHAVLLQQPRAQRERPERDGIEIWDRSGAAAAGAMSCREVGHILLILTTASSKRAGTIPGTDARSSEGPARISHRHVDPHAILLEVPSNSGSRANLRQIGLDQTTAAGCRTWCTRTKSNRS